MRVLWLIMTFELGTVHAIGTGLIIAPVTSAKVVKKSGLALRKGVKNTAGNAGRCLVPAGWFYLKPLD